MRYREITNHFWQLYLKNCQKPLAIRKKAEADCFPPLCSLREQYTLVKSLIVNMD